MCAAILGTAARSGAVTVVEPIARLTLEGGYDSNPLYDGLGGDRVGRVSPELGFRLHDRLYLASLSWRGDWVGYERRAPNGIWNHHGDLKLDARLTRRLALDVTLKTSWAFDPLGLAQLGVFRTERQSALVVTGSVRTQYRATPVTDVASTLTERTVRFEDGTGGAMHATGVEALYHTSERLALGAAYSLAAFQAFDGPGVPNELSWAHGLRARAQWRATRRVTLDAYAGPATWFGKEGNAVVPEAAVQALITTREMGVRLNVSHGLGIGSTARPGLVDAFEFGGERHFGEHRRWVVRSDGGIWHSGLAPTGADASTGWAVGGEVGRLVAGNLRLSIAATHLARLDDPSPALRRTTLGLRVRWEMPVH